MNSSTRKEFLKLEFMPEELIDIIIDYKNQFERKYDCSIKHNHLLLDNQLKKDIIFYKNPFKFQCKTCGMIICDNHADSFVFKNTKNDNCISCHITDVQIFKILKDIDYDKKILNKSLFSLKTMLFLFEDHQLKMVNFNIKKIFAKYGFIDPSHVYDCVNDVYKKLVIFDFFEPEI